MTYEQFIARTQHHIDLGERLLSDGATHETREFRNWWLEVRGDVELMSGEYELPGPFGSHRHFRAMVVIPDRNFDRRKFEEDMGDTLAELRRFITQYGYGAPRRKSEAAKPTRSAQAGGHTFNISGSNIGAVQAAETAVAQGIHMDVTSLCRLSDALGELRAQVSSVAIPEDVRTEGLQLIDKATTATRASPPNSKRMLWCLQGLAALESIVDKAPAAWHGVKLAAHAMGLTI